MLSLVIGLALALAAPLPGDGGIPEGSALRFAKAYAPMLWPAVDEPVYPTLPHAFAFDGVAIDTSSRGAACELRTDRGGRADFGNPAELSLGETCDRVALKRRFRPLAQDAGQGAGGGDGVGPRPRARVLYRGPELFSGSVDISDLADEVCGRRLDNLKERLKRHFFDVGSFTNESVNLQPDTASGRCRGELRYRDERFVSGKRAPDVEVRIRPAWFDTCRRALVARKPDSAACWKDGPETGVQPRLVASVGNRALDAERLTIFRRQDVLLPPRYLIQYWFYYAYDRGVDGHRHDGEHAFVFLEGSPNRPPQETDPVIAIVGGGHEEDTANNILTSGSIRTWPQIVDAIVVPQRLPQHAMMLAELGKHASAPDRNLNGRFEAGFDANLWPENAWGSRDSQTALLGKAQIGKMQAWYSFPRSEEAVFTEESAWLGGAGTGHWLSVEYSTGYPSATFKSFAAKVAPRLGSSTACDFGQERTYRLMPIKVLADLQRTIKEQCPIEEGWPAVRGFLQKHREQFWEPGCVSELPEKDVDGKLMQQLGYWLDTENEKRDVWTHRKFLDPDSVFKTHLFPRFAIGASFMSPVRSDRSYGVALQFADLLKARHFHDSTVELAVYHEPHVDEGFRRNVALTFENFRGRHRGWYLGGSSNADVETHRRWYFRAGYVFQYSSLERFSPTLRRFKLNIRFGGRGLVWGGGPLAEGGTDRRDRSLAFELSANLTFGAWPSKHPLKFFPDLGHEEKESR